MWLPNLFGLRLCHCQAGPERSEGTSRSNLYSYSVIARGGSPEAILVRLLGMEIATHLSGARNDPKREGPDKSGNYKIWR
jgi:hypothetical protein